MVQNRKKITFIFKLEFSSYKVKCGPDHISEENCALAGCAFCQGTCKEVIFAN